MDRLMDKPKMKRVESSEEMKEILEQSTTPEEEQKDKEIVTFDVTINDDNTIEFPLKDGTVVKLREPSLWDWAQVETKAAREGGLAGLGLAMVAVQQICIGWGKQKNVDFDQIKQLKSIEDGERLKKALDSFRY